MCIDICIDMCTDMCVDMCIDIHVYVRTCVRRSECERRFFRECRAFFDVLIAGATAGYRSEQVHDEQLYPDDMAQPHALQPAPCCCFDESDSVLRASRDSDGKDGEPCEHHHVIHEHCMYAMTKKISQIS